ncbi:uncharacterized protein LOC118734931 [Rhagoletis pomonella]|uniref:uncharacterized protein LOC118734931 n=1 Tax=Rhagoletis pomonella TaxID=28610 RepID=UPI001785DBF0|nr:uncharacterized protein LOC118734931 [Rhagoletis pomonella]
MTNAREDKTFSGKYRAPTTTTARKQPAKVLTSNKNFLQKRNDLSRRNSISSGQKVSILRNDQEMNNDGSYRYQYETGNGIIGTEQGTAGVAIQGTSSYVSPEGLPIKLTYTADETGYHPVGDHIPKTPDYVLRAIEYIRTHPFNFGKIDGVTPKLSTEIVPPLRTSAYPGNLNYKASSFNTQKTGLTKNRRQKNTSRNNLKRRI